ncbi:transmembrane protein 47-like isoform X2 [Gigantopelta aegis]|uniref:transmembrane protein 47-like isoform X2 n=1 Tax=Gigantopelta aegis TaxID=1735272 RepID=UPI001B888D73|nr:transmembrane protein 47-like isoform X2 [Gigantopelta aegis]
MTRNSYSAPIVAIETVIAVRPSRVIAVLCGCISIMLLMLSIAATTWLEADGRREGLWELCKWRDSKGVEVDCEKNNPKTWLDACRSLCLLALFSALISVIIACVGLKTENFQWKYHYYKASMVIMFIAVTFEVIALIIFPVKFLEEVDERPYKKWEFGWAYGIGWGSAIFMFGCAILLLLDRDSEEVVYREKTIYQREPEPEEI